MTRMKNDKPIREHLLYLLQGDGAHLEFEAAIKDLPESQYGKTPTGAAHSPWQLLEHLRITQWDVLQSVRDAKHISPEFPAGYWPNSAAPPDGSAWKKSAEGFRSDLDELAGLVSNNSTDVLAELPHAAGQTIFRKVAMAADHNAYHMGQFVLLRRLLGSWQ